MYYYSVYGLNLRSEFPLDYDKSVPGNSDIDLRSAAIPENGKLGEYSDSCVIGQVNSHLMFKVTGGTDIEVIPNPRSRTDVQKIAPVISNVLLSVALRQRGYLVLHASSVRKSGGPVVAFVGDCGAGKSTTVAYLQSKGYDVVDDDLLVLRRTHAGIEVFPGPRRIRLRNGAAPVVGEGFMSLPLANSFEEKRNFELQELKEQGPFPLRHIYLLEWHDDPLQGRAELLDGVGAFRAILPHVYAGKLNLTHAQRLSATSWMADLIKSVSIAKLVRPAAHSSLEIVRKELDRILATSRRREFIEESNNVKMCTLSSGKN